jgi:hypothetical protein
MSSRFRIKSGDTEIEFEGSAAEVSSKFKEAFDWLKNTPSQQSDDKTQKGGKSMSDTKTEDKKQGRASSRGGSRSAVVGPALDELVAEGFFGDFKTLSEVCEELKRKTVPSNIKTVNSALARRVPKVLDRIKNDQGNWVYRKKT